MAHLQGIKKTTENLTGETQTSVLQNKDFKCLKCAQTAKGNQGQRTKGNQEYDTLTNRIY